MYTMNGGVCTLESRSSVEQWEFVGVLSTLFQGLSATNHLNVNLHRQSFFLLLSLFLTVVAPHSLSSFEAFLEFLRRSNFQSAGSP